MPTQESPANSPAEVWLRTSDALVAGIHHTLNNRLAALTAVAQVLEAEVPPDHPLRGSLRAEAERLEGAVALLALVARPRHPRPEPVQVADLLRDTVRLYHQHHDLRDIPCTVSGPDDALPLWGEPAELTHALLVLLAAAGREAARTGSGVEVRYEGDEARVTLQVSPAGPGFDGAEAGAAGALLRAWGGEVEGGEGGFTVRLPTLLEARRREGR